MAAYQRVILYFDGACRRNPHGPAGCGWVLHEMDNDGAEGELIETGNDFLGYNVSSNQAEYEGLTQGLIYVRDNISCNFLYIRGDPELTILQMEGTYKVRSPNIRPYYDEAMEVLSDVGCNYTFRHIPRARNWEADQLANAAIDSG
jgi:ribonuclease HI